MILVTGTKRSGTSLLMQVLRAAGYPALGDAFPLDWGTYYRDANPEGFFESRFREGVNFTNNPDPESGAYLHPADVQRHAIKIFVPGLTRTDLAFVERVVAGVRDVREYEASIRAFDRLEDARGEAARSRERPTPHLEWWRDNYALLADALMRRYPMRAVSLDALVTDPESILRDLLDFLGGGDLAKARAVVKPELRRQDRADLPWPDALETELRTSFELLFEVLAHGPPEGEDWLDRLGETHARLAPRIEADFERVASSREAALP